MASHPGNEFLSYNPPVNPLAIPIRLDLKRDEKLEIDWQDGRKSVYTIAYLRAMCPCAQCKAQQEEQRQRPNLLRVLPGNHSQPLVAVKAELVGNYALRIDWSDQHGSGIYSFDYLRQISRDLP
jgi:DUF971 family protein